MVGKIGSYANTQQRIEVELGVPTPAITDDQTDTIDPVSTTVALLEQ